MPLPPEFTRKGHPKRGGRKKGSLNRRTLQKREVLELLAQGSDDGVLPREERLKAYLKSKDKRLAFDTDKMLIEHEWGRPKESIEFRDKTGGDSAMARVLELLLAVRERAKGKNS